MTAAPPPSARRAADGLLWLLAASISLSTTGMQASVLALGGLTLVSLGGRWGVVRRTPLDGVLALLLGVLALSTLASGHPLAAAGGWRRLWVLITYFVVYWWLRDRAHAARFVRVLVAAGALVAAYGILQHYTGADWYRALLGRATEVRPRMPSASGFAVVGFFRNYLTFAHTMLFPLAWAGALSLVAVPLGLLAAPLLVVAVVFSTARGAWLAMAAVGLGLALLGRGRRAWLMIGGAAAAATIAFLAAPDLRGLAAGMLDVRGGNQGRIGIYRANLDMIRDHPVLGLGFGRYRTAASRYYDAYPEADRRSHAHSNYLHLAAEAGLAGLAAFALLLATALRLGWAALARAPDGVTWATAAGAWVGMIAFLVGGVTQYSFGDNEVAMAMWAALAVLMRCREA